MHRVTAETRGTNSRHNRIASPLHARRCSGVPAAWAEAVRSIDAKRMWRQFFINPSRHLLEALLIQQQRGGEGKVTDLAAGLMRMRELL